VSRRAARFTQADVARAIRAAQQCGAGAVEIKPDGTILVPVSPEPTTAEPGEKQREPVEPRRKVVL
jgi:hypothetical protein